MTESADRQTPSHMHPEDQIFSLEEGLAIIETEQGHWALPPGQIAWIPAGQMHSLSSCGKVAGWSLYLPQGRREGLPQRPVILSRSPLLQEVAIRLILPPKSSLSTDSIRAHLLDVLWDELAQAVTVPLHLPFPTDPKLRQVTQKMASEPGTKRTVRELAHEAAMSERSFLRRFQAETGLSTGRWQQQLRVRLALEELANGRSVTETAAHVGFDNISAFIRLFTRVLGETPASYVKKSCRDDKR